MSDFQRNGSIWINRETGRPASEGDVLSAALADLKTLRDRLDLHRWFILVLLIIDAGLIFAAFSLASRFVP